MRTKLFIAALVLVSSVGHAQFVKQGGKAVMFVLDISGSMQGTNISKVRATLAKVAATEPSSTYLGLASFSGCGASYAALNVPLSQNAGERVVQQANALQPNGATDIVAGLEKARADIARLEASNPGICVNLILLSDGGDTCSGAKKAEEAAKEITEGTCNEINVISIGVAEWDSDVLEDVANAGKGVHKNVEKNEDLEEVIREVAESEESLETELGGVGHNSGEYKEGKEGENKNPNGKTGTKTGKKDQKDDPNKTRDPAEAEEETEKTKESGTTKKKN